MLFVSPYPICPPTHGGGLFMYCTLRELARTCEVHAIVMLDYASQRAANEELLRYCETVEFYVRTRRSRPAPRLHRAARRPRISQTGDSNGSSSARLCCSAIDVIQLEYTALGQYARPFQRLVCALFEHDVYFQSIARALPFIRGAVARLKARFEYLRAHPL